MGEVAADQLGRRSGGRSRRAREQGAGRPAELAGLRAQQAATSEILKLISRSSYDLQPILDTVLEKATQLVGAEGGTLYQPVEGALHPVATHGLPPELRDLLAREPLRPGRGTLAGRVALELRTVHIPDVLGDPEYRWAAGQRAGRFRTVLGVPMLRDGRLVLIIGRMSRRFDPSPAVTSSWWRASATRR